MTSKRKLEFIYETIEARKKRFECVQNAMAKAQENTEDHQAKLVYWAKESTYGNVIIVLESTLKQIKELIEEPEDEE